MPTKVVSESNLNTSSLDTTQPETSRDLLEKINYSDFEHGLSPADPWESSLQNDDLDALREIIGPSLTAPKTNRREPYVSFMRATYATGHHLRT